jgi:hypothetical protein
MGIHVEKLEWAEPSLFKRTTDLLNELSLSYMVSRALYI